MNFNEGFQKRCKNLVKKIKDLVIHRLKHIQIFMFGGRLVARWRGKFKPPHFFSFSRVVLEIQQLKRIHKNVSELEQLHISMMT